MKSFSLLTTAVCGALLHMQAAAAEEAVPTTINVDSVVVTGQKIERTQMETVSSVLVMDSEYLSDTTRADNFYDIVDLAPNVTNTGGFNSLAIRGIANSGPTALNNGAGTIGIFVDNSLLTARATSNNGFSIWDLDRVEILRGPQSTTGGRNSLAGQIIMHTKNPEFTSNGAAKFLFGTHGTFQTALMQTGPISDNLAYRVTADYQHTNGYVDNDILNDDEFNRNTLKNFRVKLLYNMESGGEALLTVAHNNFDERGDATVDPSLGSRKSRMNYPTRWETDTTTVSLKLTKPIDEHFQFESNTGYAKGKFRSSADFDGSNPISVVNFFADNIPTDIATIAQKTDEYTFNQEFLLHYKDDVIKSVAGFYYAQGELDDGYITSNAYFDFSGLPVLLKDDTDPDERFKTYAIFADVDYKLNNQFTLMGGLRLNKEERKSSVSSLTRRAFNYATPGINGLVDASLASFAGSKKSDNDSFVVLPKLGFNYAWSDSLSTGFVVQKGYRPGGVSVNPIRGTIKRYDDEETLNYEASLRARVNNKLNVNANLFYTDWKDQQVQVPSPNSVNPNDYLVENAGESHLYGLELEANYAVNRHWNINSGIGYSKTKIDDFTVNGVDYSGKEFQFSRNWTVNLASSYRFDSGWFMHVNVSHASQGASAFNNDNTKLDAFTIVNAKVGYETERWDVYAYGNNLFNDKYTTQRITNSTYGDTVYGDPQVVGIVGNLRW